MAVVEEPIMRWNGNLLHPSSACHSMLDWVGRIVLLDGERLKQWSYRVLCSLRSLVLHRYQPFYNVLVDSDDIPFQTTYVAEENILPQAAANGEVCSPIVHPEVSLHDSMYAF